MKTDSPHLFRPWVGTLERHRDPKGLGTQLQPMISRRSLNSEVSHGPGGVDLEPGTKPMGRTDLAHPLITDTDLGWGQNKCIASSRVIILYQRLYPLGIKLGGGRQRGRREEEGCKYVLLQTDPSFGIIKSFEYRWWKGHRGVIASTPLSLWWESSSSQIVAKLFCVSSHAEAVIKTGKSFLYFDIPGNSLWYLLLLC